MIKNDFLSQTLYWTCWGLDIISIFVLNYFFCKHYEIPRKKAMLFTGLTYLLGVLVMLLQGRIETGAWGATNMVKVFIWIPVVAYPVAKILKLSWRKCCDFMAPCICLSHGIGHIGCIFAGCCHGYPSSFGLYSKVAGCVTFPIQIIETVSALLIVVIMLKLNTQRKRITGHRAYPIRLC